MSSLVSAFSKGVVASVTKSVLGASTLAACDRNCAACPHFASCGAGPSIDAQFDSNIYSDFEGIPNHQSRAADASFAAFLDDAETDFAFGGSQTGGSRGGRGGRGGGQQGGGPHAGRVTLGSAAIAAADVAAGRGDDDMAHADDAASSSHFGPSRSNRSGRSSSGRSPAVGDAGLDMLGFGMKV